MKGAIALLDLPPRRPASPPTAFAMAARPGVPLKMPFPSALATPPWFSSGMARSASSGSKAAHARGLTAAMDMRLSLLVSSTAPSAFPPQCLARATLGSASPRNTAPMRPMGPSAVNSMFRRGACLAPRFVTPTLFPYAGAMAGPTCPLAKPPGLDRAFSPTASAQRTLIESRT